MKWINIYLIIFTSLFSMLQSFLYADNTTDTKAETIITEEGIPLTPVPIETLKKVAYYISLFGLNESIEEQKKYGLNTWWNPETQEIKEIILFPVYDIEGRIIEYDFTAYIGKDEPPKTVEDILNATREFFERDMKLFYEDDLITKRKPQIEEEEKLLNKLRKESTDEFIRVIDDKYICGYFDPYYEYYPGVAVNIGIPSFLIKYWYVDKWVKMYVSPDATFSRFVSGVVERDDGSKHMAMFYCYKVNGQEVFIMALYEGKLEVIPKEKIFPVKFHILKDNRSEEAYKEWKIYEKYNDKEIKDWYNSWHKESKIIK